MTPKEDQVQYEVPAEIEAAITELEQDPSLQSPTTEGTGDEIAEAIIQSATQITQKTTPQVLTEKAEELEKISNALKDCPIFEGLSEQTLNKIAHYCAIEQVIPGQQLINDIPEEGETPLLKDKGLVMILGNTYGAGLGVSIDGKATSLKPNTVLGERGFVGSVRAATIVSNGTGNILKLAANLDELDLTVEEENIVIKNVIKNTYLGDTNKALADLNKKHKLWPMLAEAEEVLVQTLLDNRASGETLTSTGELEPGTIVDPIEGYAWILDSGEIQIIGEDSEGNEVILTTIESTPESRHIIGEITALGGETTAKEMRVKKTAVLFPFPAENEKRTPTEQRQILEAFRAAVDLKLAKTTEKLRNRLEKEAGFQDNKTAKVASPREVLQQNLPTLMGMLGKLRPLWDRAQTREAIQETANL